jgi:YVTN family beta-propeller protein
MARSLTDSSTHARRRRGTAGFLLACVMVLAVAPAAQAATATNAWLAKVGSSGANGTATIQAFTTGTGNVVLKLKKLPASRTLAVTLLKTSCKGSTLLTLASVKTTSTGAATRTSSLTASQATAIKKATTGTAKFAIRIGTGTTAKCGVFAAQIVPAYKVATVTVGPAPAGVAIDVTGVWVTNWWANTLSRIDPATNTVLAVVPLVLTDQEGPFAITSGAGSLWITTTEYSADDMLPGSIIRVDPVTGSMLATIPGGRGATAIAFGYGGVWVANYVDNSVQRIDPVTNQVAATITVEAPLGITADAKGVWVVDVYGRVSKIDPTTNAVVSTIQTRETGAAVAAGGGSLWVVNPGSLGAANGAITRIDSATGLLTASIPVGEFPLSVAYAGGSVWVGLLTTPTLVRISASTNKVLGNLALSAGVYDLAATANAVWTVHQMPIPEGGTQPPNGTVTRVGY